jgi:oxygen-dependent protoporphyrinogen oxidase
VRVVIVGAGISGLSAAWAVRRAEPAAEILVLEADSRVGGKLRLGEIAGVPVDLGAEALLARRPEGLALIDELGLSDELITPLSIAASLRAGGARHALPARTMMGIPSDPEAVRASGVLSDVALARVRDEATLAPLAPLSSDISVGALVRERLGPEVVSRLVDPLLGGVYAGRADELSLMATMPGLAARLRVDGGSLLVAAAAVTSAGTREQAGAAPVFVSLRGGLARLPQALAESGRFSVRTGVTVTGISRTPEGFALTAGPVATPELITADAVVVATPPSKAARLLGALVPVAAAELAGVATASMAIITLAYRGITPPPGSGLLVGSDEGFAVKAVTVSSQKWPIAPAGLTVLRASVGRIDQTHVLQRDDAELIALATRELAPLLDIHAEPVDALVTRWGGGLPQYTVGHLDRVARLRAAIDSVPGLGLCGATLEGIGIPACIASAELAATQALRGIGGRAESSGERQPR